MRAQLFEVIVTGTLGTALLDGIEQAEGFIAAPSSEDYPGATRFQGWVADQARLHSLIQMLRDLNIEIISVNPVGLSSTTASSTTDDTPDWAYDLNNPTSWPEGRSGL